MRPHFGSSIAAEVCLEKLPVFFKKFNFVSGFHVYLQIKFKHMIKSFHKPIFFLCILICSILYNCQNRSQAETAADYSNSNDTVISKPDDTLQSATAEKTQAKVTSLTQETFCQNVFDFHNQRNWKYLGNKPCIIDFYADWCRPCKAMEPILEKLAKEYAGQVLFYKVNVDQESALANYFQINSIPFLLYCPMNDLPKSTMGGLSEEELRKYIELIR